MNNNISTIHRIKSLTPEQYKLFRKRLLDAKDETEIIRIFEQIK